MTNKNGSILLTEYEALHSTIECLTQHIPLETSGAFNSHELFQLLVRAACNCDSIENTAKGFNQAPCGRTIRYHFNKINNFSELESQLNTALLSQVLPRIRKGKLKLAIDLNLIPYYGQPSEEEKPYIYRSQAQQGTCSFYAYATLYVIKKGKRLTLAIKGVKPTDTSVAIITHLLDKINPLNVNIKTLYLDRGFFSIPVIRWLKALEIPFIIPAIRRGGRLIHRELFTFKQMLSFLRQAIDKLYQVIDAIYLPSG